MVQTEGRTESWDASDLYLGSEACGGRGCTLKLKLIPQAETFSTEELPKTGSSDTRLSTFIVIHLGHDGVYVVSLQLFHDRLLHGEYTSSIAEPQKCY